MADNLRVVDFQKKPVVDNSGLLPDLESLVDSAKAHEITDILLFVIRNGEPEIITSGTGDLPMMNYMLDALKAQLWAPDEDE